MLLPALPILLAAPVASAATSMVSFTNARLDRVDVSSGTVISTTTTVTTNGVGDPSPNPASITYTIGNLNLDDDGNDTDTLVVTLSLLGINGVPVNQNVSQGRVGIALPEGGSNEIESNVNGGEGISYSFSNIVATGTTAGTFAMATGNFQSLSLFNFGAAEAYNASSTGGTIIVNGTGSPVLFTNPNDTGFTFSPTDANGISKGSILSTTFDVVIIPEPSSSLLASSALLLGLLRRRR